MAALPGGAAMAHSNTDGSNSSSESDLIPASVVRLGEAHIIHGTHNLHVQSNENSRHSHNARQNPLNKEAEAHPAAYSDATKKAASTARGEDLPDNMLYDDLNEDITHQNTAYPPGQPRGAVPGTFDDNLAFVPLDEPMADLPDISPHLNSSSEVDNMFPPSSNEFKPTASSEYFISALPYSQVRHVPYQKRRHGASGEPTTYTAYRTTAVSSARPVVANLHLNMNAPPKKQPCRTADPSRVDLTVDSDSESSSVTEFLIRATPRNDLSDLPELIAPLRKACLSGTAFYREDLERLTSDKWLNDKIVNAYLALLARKCPSTFAFSTFVFPAMVARSIEEVVGWFDDVDLFSYDTMLFPVFKESHWTLVVVKRFMISYYNSLGALDMTVLDTVRRFLSRVYRRQRQAARPFIGRDMARHLPMQENGSDCGVFCCMYARLAADPLSPDMFKARDIPLLRLRMLHELLAGELIYEYK